MELLRQNRCGQRQAPHRSRCHDRRSHIGVVVAEIWTISIIIASDHSSCRAPGSCGEDINHRPKKLVAGLKDVEEGAFNHEVKIYTTDEFSVIGNGFQPNDRGTA